MSGLLWPMCTAVILVYSFRRFRLLPFPTVLVLLYLLSQFTLLLIHDGLFRYEMLRVFERGGVDRRFLETQLIYTFSAVIAVFFARTSHLSNARVALRPEPPNLERDPKSRDGRQRIGQVAVFISGAHLALLSLVADWGKIWSHSVYLEGLTSDNAVSLFGGTLPATAMRMLPLAGLLSSVASCLVSDSKSILLKASSYATTLIYFSILLGIHSRTAALVPLVIAAYAAFMGSRRAWVKVFTLLFLALLSVGMALVGRAERTHGISTIPGTLSATIAGASATGAADTLSNVFEGAAVTAESLYARADFPTRYKVLALSPLPSFVDGYSAIREGSEIRLHRFVPMSAIGEIAHFGWVYLVALLLILYLAVRCHGALLKGRPSLFLLTNFLLMFSGYLLFSYPLRNGLRFTWAVVYISVGAFLFEAVRGNRRMQGGRSAGEDVSNPP